MRCDRICGRGNGRRLPLSQHASGDDIEALIPFFEQQVLDHGLAELHFFVLGRRSTEVSEGSQIVARRGRHEVRRQLQLDEAIVGNVFIESVDDAIATAPGVQISSARRIFSVFPVTGHVEPVAAPSLAVVR
jgi:hypothetical protein